MSPTLAARRARRVLYVSIAIGIALLVMGQGYMLAATLGLTQEVRDTQIDGTPTGQKLVRSADRILDCTNPDGACTKRNQQATARAVSDLTGNLTRVIVISAACSAGLPDGLTVRQREVRIQSCVIDRLSRDTGRP